MGQGTGSDKVTPRPGGARQEQSGAWQDKAVFVE